MLLGPSDYPGLRLILDVDFVSQFFYERQRRRTEREREWNRTHMVLGGNPNYLVPPTVGMAPSPQFSGRPAPVPLWGDNWDYGSPVGRVGYMTAPDGPERMQELRGYPGAPSFGPDVTSMAASVALDAGLQMAPQLLQAPTPRANGPVMVQIPRPRNPTILPTPPGPRGGGQPVAVVGPAPGVEPSATAPGNGGGVTTVPGAPGGSEPNVTQMGINEAQAVRKAAARGRSIESINGAQLWNGIEEPSAMPDATAERVRRARTGGSKPRSGPATGYGKLYQGAESFDLPEWIEGASRRGAAYVRKTGGAAETRALQKSMIRAGKWGATAARVAPYATGALVAIGAGMQGSQEAGLAGGLTSAATSTAGQVGGAVLGGTIGTMLAPFTAGASIPIGATIGGIVGGMGGQWVGSQANKFTVSQVDQGTGFGAMMDPFVTTERERMQAEVLRALNSPAYIASRPLEPYI